jgi:hypothetical protein
VKLPLLGGLAAALILSAAGCAGDDPPPLVTPPPITTADGTVIPLPPNVADGATDAQRDAYLDQVLAPQNLTGQQEGARTACAVLDGGQPPATAIFSLLTTMPPTREDVGRAFRVAYAGTVAYCPAHRALFDSMRDDVQAHGGSKVDPVTGQEPAPIQVDPRLREPQTTTTTRSRTHTTTTTRPKTSGEEQHDWGCQQGYIPASEC